MKDVKVWDRKYKCWMQCGWGIVGPGPFIAKGGRGYSMTEILNHHWKRFVICKIHPNETME